MTFQFTLDPVACPGWGQRVLEHPPEGQVINWGEPHINVKAAIFSIIILCMYVCNRYSMAVSDVWHIHVPRPEGSSPEGEGVYMPYITHCHAICYINPV